MRSIKQIFEDLKSKIITELRAAGNDVIDSSYGVENPLALAHAAEIRSIENLIADAVRQTNPLTADSIEENSMGMLEHFARLANVSRVKATRGEYTIIIKKTGEESDNENYDELDKNDKDNKTEGENKAENGNEAEDGDETNNDNEIEDEDNADAGNENVIEDDTDKDNEDKNDEADSKTDDGENVKTKTSVDENVEVEIGTEFTGVSGNYGVNLISTASISVNSRGQKTVKVRALESGSRYSLSKGAIISFNTPIPDIQQTAEIISVEVESIDDEDIETFREKIIYNFGHFSNGGTISDYRLWAKQIKGVRNAYPYSAIYDSELTGDKYAAYLGLGFPRIYIEFSKDGQEDQEDIIEKYIDSLLEKAPFCAGCVIVEKCKIREIKIKIKKSNLSKEKSNIKNLIEEYLDNIRPYIGAIDEVKNNMISKMSLYIKILMVLQEKDYRFELSDFDLYEGEDEKEKEFEYNGENKSETYELKNNEYFVLKELTFEPE